MKSCCVALGTFCSIVMEHDSVRKMYRCMCDWVTMLYSGKLTEHCKPATMEKNKNHYKESLKIFEIIVDSHEVLERIPCTLYPLSPQKYLVKVQDNITTGNLIAV